MRLRRMVMAICAATTLGVLVVMPASGADPPPIGSDAQGSQTGSLTADALRGTMFTANATTTIGKVRAYLVGNGTPQNLTATIYLASFAEPNRLVGRSDPLVVSHTGNQWVEFNLTLGAYIEQNRSYYLLLHSGASGGAVSIGFTDSPIWWRPMGSAITSAVCSRSSRTSGSRSSRRSPRTTSSPSGGAPRERSMARERSRGSRRTAGPSCSRAWIS